MATTAHFPFPRDVLADVFYPDDLAILQRAFDRLCALLGLPLPGTDADDLAARLLILFRTGLVTEEELVCRAAMQPARSSRLQAPTQNRPEHVMPRPVPLLDCDAYFAV